MSVDLQLQLVGPQLEVTTQRQPSDSESSHGTTTVNGIDCDSIAVSNTVHNVDPTKSYSSHTLNP